MSDELVKVKLYGHLRKFGKEFELAVKSPREAARALCKVVPGFEKFMKEAEAKGIVFAIFNGKRNVGEQELDLGAKAEILIATVTGGRKQGGLFQTIIGAVIFAASFFVPGMQVWGHQLGIALMLGVLFR